MKTLDQIAAELAGYDPQALSADTVNAFLAKLVEPVTEVQQVGVFPHSMHVEAVARLSLPAKG